MPNFTKILNLEKPLRGEFYSIEKHNENSDKIDLAIEKITVPTIERLKNMIELQEGDIVDIQGYYTAGDGAHHKRKIVSEDDGSGVQLVNGLWANIVHNGEVNVSWFGVNEDLVNNSTKLEKAVNYGTSIFLDKNIEINSTINVVSTIKIRGSKKSKFDKGFSIINKVGDIFNISTSQTNYVYIEGININAKGNIFNITKDCRFGIKKSYLTSTNSSVVKIRFTHNDAWFSVYDVNDDCHFSAYGNLPIFDIKSTGNLAWLNTMTFNNCQMTGNCSNVFRIDGINQILPFNFVNCQIEDVKGENEGIVINCIGGGGGIKINFSQCYFEYIQAKNNPNIDNSCIVKTDCGFETINFNNCFMGKVLHVVNNNVSRGFRYFKSTVDFIGTVFDQETYIGYLIYNNGIDDLHVNNFNGSPIADKQVEVQRIFDPRSDRVYIDLDTDKYYYSDNGKNTDGKIDSIPNSSFIAAVGKKHFDIISKTTNNITVPNTMLDFVNENRYFDCRFYIADNIVFGVKSDVEFVDCIFQIEKFGSVFLVLSNVKFTRCEFKMPYGHSVTVDQTSAGSVTLIDCTKSGTGSISFAAPNLFVRSNNAIILNLEVLDTPYYTLKMQQEGIYDDYIAYRDELHEYEKAQSQAVEGVAMMSELAEPQPSQALLDFKKKYLGYQ